VLGTHVEQAGQLVNDSIVRFDFTHFSALTKDELTAIENEVNTVIFASLPVSSEEKTLAEAKAMGAMALFGEKYGETVRVVDAAGYSLELCGGTHAANTGNLGIFKITAESSVASGVRRIEAVTGFNVLKNINDTLALVYETAAALKCGNINALPEKAAALSAELKNKDKEIEKLKAEAAKAKAGELFKELGEVKGIKVITADMGEADANALRTMLDSAKRDDAVVIVAGKNSEKASLFCAIAPIAQSSMEQRRLCAYRAEICLSVPPRTYNKNF